MYELVYAGAGVEKTIHKRFPAAKIEDASDYIHQDRFEVVVDDNLEDEFYVFAIREGFALSCLLFRVLAQTKDSQDKVQKWIDEAKKQFEETSNDARREDR